MSYLFQGPAVEVVQPIGSFLIAAVPWHVLQEVTYPDPLRLATDPRFKDAQEQWNVGKLEGTQRPIERDRLKRIAAFIGTIDATFPNAIILAVPDAGMVQDGPGAGLDWEAGELSGRLTLSLPVGARRAFVVDGQHRLYAFPNAQLEPGARFDVVCSVFFALPRPIQAMIFATINTNQKPVRRGLAMNLYGYNIEDEEQAYWSPEKVAVFLTRRLNFDDASPLKQSIKVEAAGAPSAILLPGAKRAITMVSVVDGILSLISANPRRDRDQLKTPEKLLARRGVRANLPDDGSPLRSWYVKGRDLVLYELLVAFTREVKTQLWSGSSELTGMLNRSVGVRALFKLLWHVAREQRASEDDTKRSAAIQRRWSEVVSVVASLDFRDPYYEATDRGRRRIELVGGHAAGLIPLEQVPLPERAEVVRRANVVT